MLCFYLVCSTIYSMDAVFSVWLMRCCVQKKRISKVWIRVTFYYYYFYYFFFTICVKIMWIHSPPAFACMLSLCADMSVLAFRLKSDHLFSTPPKSVALNSPGFYRSVPFHLHNVVADARAKASRSCSFSSDRLKNHYFKVTVHKITLPVLKLFLSL